MVDKILKKYGVRKRTYDEAKLKSRKYLCNDDYFKYPSKNMAYILGLLASDGSVSLKENLIAIQLLKNDEDILLKVRDETEVERPISYYIRKETNHEIACLRNWSKQWKQDLQAYGIIPKKTFTLQPPILLAPEFRIDYIRGYFDGDGSIYSVQSQNRVFLEITGCSKVMMDWLHDELINHYNIFCNKPLTEQKHNGTIIYKIKIGDRQEIRKLHDLFYNNTDMYLQRKKDYMELLLDIPRDSNSFNKE